MHLIHSSLAMEEQMCATVFMFELPGESDCAHSTGYDSS